jgi:hypothetical protein
METGVVVDQCFWPNMMIITQRRVSSISGLTHIVNCFSVEIVEGVTSHPLTVIERNSVGADLWKLSVATHDSLEETHYLQSCLFIIAVKHSKKS